MPKTKCDCGDPKCPYPDMPSLWKPEDTMVDYFVKAALWMQGHGYHDITTMFRRFKNHLIRTQFDHEIFEWAFQKWRAQQGMKFSQRK